MNARTTGVIGKKYLGKPAVNRNGLWYRLDKVYINGVAYSYFSNPPKDNPSAEAIVDTYPTCGEGVKVEIEYTESEGKGKDGQPKVYCNVEDMAPVGGTLGADDPIRKMTAPRTPDHLKSGPTPEEPMPNAAEVAQRSTAPAYTPGFTPAAPATWNSSTVSTSAPKSGATSGYMQTNNQPPDDKDWRIARSVAVKEVNAAAMGGLLPPLAETWGLPKESEIAAVARVIARFIVEG